MKEEINCALGTIVAAFAIQFCDHWILVFDRCLLWGVITVIWINIKIILPMPHGDTKINAWKNFSFTKIRVLFARSGVHDNGVWFHIFISGLVRELSRFNLVVTWVVPLPIVDEAVLVGIWKSDYEQDYTSSRLNRAVRYEVTRLSYLNLHTYHLCNKQLTCLWIVRNSIRWKFGRNCSLLYRPRIDLAKSNLFSTGNCSSSAV